jgi:hypothetical protein
MKQGRGLAHGAIMNAARKELALVLEYLGVPIHLQTFSNRLNVQKKIYLAQIAAIDLGYRYGWYIRGPYSTGLTQDSFTLKDEIASGDTEHRGFRLAPKVTKALDHAKKLWEMPPNFTRGNDDWLELLASLHYLRHIAYKPHGAKRDFDDVFELLIQSKPQFRKQKDEARTAWNRLDDYGLVKAKTLG